MVQSSHGLGQELTVICSPCRLDRCIATREWSLLFQNSRLVHKPVAFSNHMALSLQVLGPPIHSKRRTKAFKFEETWLRSSDCQAVICDAWNSKGRNQDNDGQLQLKYKIEAVTTKLREWSKNEFGIISKRIKTAENKLTRLESSSPSPSTYREMQKQKHEVLEWKHREEVLWKQHSRVLWLKEGDRNTKFFHSYATTRKRNNMIRKITDNNGNCVETEEGIAQEAVRYFQELFHQPPQQNNHREVDLQHNCLEADAINALSQPYTEEEITAALNEFHPSKAPGPDGLPAMFYQKFWPHIKTEVLEFCLQVLNEGKSVRDINSTNIVLIPKTQQPETMKHFRPISPCNVTYKLISKTIAKRMKQVMPSLISQEQSAFVQGRLITDNVLVAYELLHTMRGKRQGKNGCCAFKLDMAKAFDRVNWKFIDNIMRKMMFPAHMITTIMDCISTVTYSVIINGQRYGQFNPSRGLRQGDPISPYLFLICSEGLSALIHQANTLNNITGVRASANGVMISHLLFADDSLVFCKAKKKEAQNLRIILQTYEEISGQQINFEKSFIFF